jgi:broad specificity phosphatase PhoE
LDHLAARVSSVIIKTLENAAGDVVVIGHQDPLQAARLRLTGKPAAAQHQDKPGHCSVITLEQGDPWREVGHWRPQG